MGGGGGGNCRAAGIFLRYQIPCMNFFLGLIGVQEFFSFNFPFFLMVRPLVESTTEIIKTG